MLREADFELDFFVQSCRSPALVRGALERRSAMQREFARFIDQTTYSPPLPALPQPMHPQYARTQALRRQIIDSWEDFRHKERTQALREARRQEAVARGLAQRLLLVPAPADPNRHVAVGDAENLVAELERSLADKERPGCTRDAYADWKPKGRLSPLMAVQLFQWYLQVGGL